MSEPMTPERLAEIAARAGAARRRLDLSDLEPEDGRPIRQALTDVPALAAEVERLGAERDALRGLLAGVDAALVLPAPADTREADLAHDSAVHTRVALVQMVLGEVLRADRDAAGAAGELAAVIAANPPTYRTWKRRPAGGDDRG